MAWRLYQNSSTFGLIARVSLKDVGPLHSRIVLPLTEVRLIKLSTHWSMISAGDIVAVLNSTYIDIHTYEHIVEIDKYINLTSSIIA